MCMYHVYTYKSAIVIQSVFVCVTKRGGGGFGGGDSTRLMIPWK